MHIPDLCFLRYTTHLWQNRSPYRFMLHYLRLERALQRVWYRITKTTLQIVLLADWRFFKTTASQTLREIASMKTSTKKTLAINELYSLWFCIKHFADPFLHEDKLIRLTCMTTMRNVRSVYSLIKDWFSVTYRLQKHFQSIINDHTLPRLLVS